MKKSFFGIVTSIVLLFSADLLAEARGSSAETLPSNPATQRTDSLILGAKSYTYSGRLSEYEGTAATRNAKSKNEVRIGYRFNPDWGAYAQFTQQGYAFQDSSRNYWRYNDPSLSILHPAWINEPTFKMSGYFRQYFPTTKRSELANIYQSAYYLSTNKILDPKTELYNQLIPRYFFQSGYKADDTTWYVEDRTVLSYRVGKNWKAGIGHWSQYETHSRTAAGLSVELEPQIEYYIGQNVHLGPHIFVPVVAKDRVYEGPRAASTDQIYGELLIEATL